MAFVPPHDRVLDTSTSNSQTIFSITGSGFNTSYNTFSPFMSIGDTTIGGVVEEGVAFASGVLTYSASNQVTVTTAFETKGTFSSSGTKKVFMALPASRSAQTISPPSGRLTLTSGVAVMNSNVAAASSVLYTPSVGSQAPSYDGTTFSLKSFSELANVLANAATGNAGPAAAVPNANYDMYLWWDNSGTPYLTRSDYWKRSATVTMTLANPCVVSYAGSDFADGTPIVFTNSGGALPSHIVSGTTYFVKRTGPLGTPTSTFNVAATVGGAAISTAADSQSGTHTATAGDDRGAVATAASGNCERQAVGGLLLNKNAITNGPAAARGLYVGTIRTNSAGTVDWNLGGTGAGGIPATLGLWNAYNTQPFGIFIGDTTGRNSTTTANTYRQTGGITTNGIYLIRGIDRDPIDAIYACSGFAGVTNQALVPGIGIGTVVAASGSADFCLSTSIAAFMKAIFKGLAGQGWTSIVPLEYNQTTTAGFWSSNIAAGVAQNGLSAIVWQ